MAAIPALGFFLAGATRLCHRSALHRVVVIVLSRLGQGLFRIVVTAHAFDSQNPQQASNTTSANLRPWRRTKAPFWTGIDPDIESSKT